MRGTCRHARRGGGEVDSQKADFALKEDHVVGLKEMIYNNSRDAGAILEWRCADGCRAADCWRLWTALVKNNVCMLLACLPVG
uniref:Uncharacterized protein n=1 Tax=Arundo donax TaxID=35708 RepID=A0A0A9FZK2_ARUDO